jgi:Family of unknown function (DUF5995)
VLGASFGIVRGEEPVHPSVWGPAQQEIAGLLQAEPEDVPAVVDQLTKLQDVLGRVPPLLRDNPVCAINQVYLRAVDGVLEALYAGGFHDPAFVSGLTVELTARYGEALRAWARRDGDGRCPRVWAGVFRRVADPRLPPLAAVSAAVNAHLHFDLPFALVTTLDHAGGEPADDGGPHHDHGQLIQIFATSVPGLPPGRLDRWHLLTDTMSGCLDEWWEGDTGRYARDVSWRLAQRLWGCRHDLTATARCRADLDRVTSDLGRLLLSPMGDFLR